MEVETKVVHLFVKNKSRSVKVNSWRFLLVIVYTRDGTGQDFLDPTGKFQNLRRSTGF